ncbi:hypothetical protein [Halpernia sp. GG3]
MKTSIELELAQNAHNKSSGNPGFVNSGRRAGKRDTHSQGMGEEMDSGERNGGGLNQMEDENDYSENEAPKMNKADFSGFSGQRNGFDGISKAGNTINDNGNYRNIADGNPIELKSK